MIIKLDLEGDLFERIETLVKDGKYNDLYQFIKLAINNQLQEEKSGVTDSGDFEKKSTKNPLQSITTEIQQNLANLLSDTELEESEIAPLSSSLIWSFYNRFFPVKVVVRQLALMLSDDKQWIDLWIELSLVQDQAFFSAEEFSDKLKEYEDEKDVSRNEKLSTGLPLPSSELKGLRKSERKKRENKLIASKIRFQEQFLGSYIKKHSTFKGACFEMGLIRVKIEHGACLVSLTDLGREFAIMENPIMDNDEYNKAFSDDEVKFILEKIIPKFELEKIIVDRILNELKNNELSSEEIDKIFEDEKLRYYSNTGEIKEDRKKKLLNSITQERVATMGRLSEMRVVNWRTDKEGKSNYSLKHNKNSF